VFISELMPSTPGYDLCKLRKRQLHLPAYPAFFASALSAILAEQTELLDGRHGSIRESPVAVHYSIVGI
jgi:hypothetical protein